MPPSDGTYTIKGQDGDVKLKSGEWYINSKARARRMMLNSLSSDARRVYACLELATMGFSQELAVTMDGGKIRNLAPADILRQTGLSRQNCRRGIEELESEGLAQRRSDDSQGLRNGHVLLYSWASPRPREEKANVVERDYIVPEWFPAAAAALRPFLSHYKIRLTTDDVVARDYIPEIEQLARDYKDFVDRAARTLEKVRAAPKTHAPSLLVERNRKELKKKEPSSSSAFSTVVESEPPEEKAEEEDCSYQSFKSQYPPDRFDEPKTKPLFEGLKPAEKRRCIERLQQYVACERWQGDGGHWIPLSSNWIKAYDTDPPPALKRHTAVGADGDEEFFKWQRESHREISELLRRSTGKPRNESPPNS